MPARKPQALITRHETAAERKAREESEARLRPNRQLPLSAPVQIKDMKIAAEAWRRVMREYRSIEGEIVTRLDLDLLLDYCVLAEQVHELDAMRATSREIYKNLSKLYSQFMKNGQETDAVMMASKVTGAFDAVVKLDGRVDRKRDLMFKMRQHLYLTPRSRAGVAPPQKEREKEVDPLEAFLNEVTEYVNDGQNEQ
ncbi:MAG: P27 family phage terminase small subunit [Anaerolineaceae bacterium]|nr:P27 family phage terminase small subunit [Anaerolineaceae bacterium]